MRKKYFLKNQKNSNINVKNYKINTKKFYDLKKKKILVF